MENLKIDHWSKGVASFFAAASLAALALSNQLIFVTCLGGFLYGVGEWINHPIQTRIVSPAESGYPGWIKGSGCLRNNSSYGVAIAVIGTAIFIFGILKILYVSE